MYCSVYHNCRTQQHHPDNSVENQAHVLCAHCYWVSLHTAIGFNVETVTYKNLKFQVWDLGGQTSIR